MLLAAWCASAWSAAAQAGPVSAQVSVVYTGRSLGALGVRRSQDEHDLLTEQSVAERRPFRLVSHLAWRAPGIVVFLPSQEPQGDELAYTLARRGEAERLDTVRALVSAQVLLLQDPWRPAPDLIAMLERNPRRRLDFPDLVETRVAVSRLRSTREDRIFIVERPGAVWPEDPAAWTVGEMNRVDILDSRVFELPLNLGELGPRATLLRAMRDSARSTAALVLTADLGHQEGDLDVARQDRARLDFTALRELGYTVSVPFEFELSLGAVALAELQRAFPQITLLAANVRARDSSLFVSRQLIQDGLVRIGLIGLVNPAVRDRLPRAALQDFTFESPVSAARREVALLRAEGASAVVVLSNMDAAENGLVAQEVSGIDAIVADLPLRWAPEPTRTRVELPDRPFARPGAPALVARGAANGLGVGRLDLEFRSGPSDGSAFLAAVEHRLAPVTDRIVPDTTLVREITGMATVVRRPRGDLMFPAFVDLAERHPQLRTFDDVAARGRVSKAMWEAFMARLLRVQGRAEAAVIRRLDQFPPLIGKLHENEIGAWLWTEDQIVLVDVLGADLLAMLRADARGELATSAIDPGRRTIQGHRIDDQSFYRVATSDVLFEGARGRYFDRGRRPRRQFTVGHDGRLTASNRGHSLALKDFVFGELRRIRTGATGDTHLDRIAALVAPDPPYVSLLSLAFERPTLWVSLNQVRADDAYGSVRESRVIANNSWVAGTSGRFVVSHARENSSTDLGVSLSYARQSLRSSGREDVTESADDLKLDLTLRPTATADSTPRLRPFVRGLFDTEFTPTVDRVTGAKNPRQLAVRAIGGYLLSPHLGRRIEFGLALENDLSRPNLQYGAQVQADFQWRVGRPARIGTTQVTYRLRNDVTYFVPSRRDTESDLALRYAMVHEVLVPLVDELSLAVVGDLFFFQGKVAATRAPGMSAQLRVGLTYDRLWKPRYQPFF